MKVNDISRGKHQSLQRWLLVIALLAAATGICLLLDNYVSLTSQAMVYVLAVVILSYRLGWIESVSAAFAAVMLLNFFFVPPRWTFQIERSEHFIALVTMLVVALVINRLATGMRRETETAHVNERRAHQLQHLAIALADANTAQEVQSLGQDALDTAFAGPNLLALLDKERQFASELSGEPALMATVRDGMLCCMKEAAVIGAGTSRWPDLNAWYLPLGDLRQGGHMAGAVCIQSALAHDDSGREHARALCAVLAQALWRLRLNGLMLIAQHEAQRQQLQGIFLAAISHDLRTPLAVVVGAASALQLQHDKLSAAEQQRLLASIVSEARHLSTLTENTLQLVSLENSSQSVTHGWESMEEIVGTVLARVRQHDPDHRITSVVPEKLPLIKLDPVLIAQLINNVLDNALKYTGQAIELEVSLEMSTETAISVIEQRMLVSVSDRGPGISEADQHCIFEAYTRGDHTDRASQRGSGLGLAVCRAIAQVHQGSLVLHSREGGGSRFTLSLPVDASQPVALGDLA